jgi:hypothetical protein
MALTPAEKQAAYRKRKALGNAFAVTKVREDAARLGCESEIEDILNELWDKGGLELVEKVAVLMYSVTSMVVMLHEMYPGLYGRRPGADRDGQNR